MHPGREVLDNVRIHEATKMLDLAGVASCGVVQNHLDIRVGRMTSRPERRLETMAQHRAASLSVVVTNGGEGTAPRYMDRNAHQGNSSLGKSIEL